MPRKPSIRQKRVANKIIEASVLDNPPTAGEIVEASGYGVSMKKNPQVIINSVGVKEALHEMGFNEATAKDVVKEIMLNKEAEPHARLKATDQVFKVEGSYAPEKHMNLNLEISPEEKEAARKALETLE